MGFLNNKTAFITGAGRGIGREIAISMAKEGATVALAARSTHELEILKEQIHSAGGKAIVIPLDLASEQSIKAAVAKAVSEMGPIDILVNNAGIIALHEITQTPTDIWDQVMSVNVRGVFLMCKEVLPSMIGRNEGRVINIGSTAGRRGYAEQGAYCTSKHALVGLSKVLSIETASTNVRIHMLSPGGVLTGLSSDLRAARNESEDSPEWMTSEEIAQAALYLCSQTGAAFTDELILRRHASEPWR